MTGIPAQEQDRSQEWYWHNKYPRIDQRYSSRPLPGTDRTLATDVRHFVYRQDFPLRRVAEDITEGRGISDDVAYACHEYTAETITYTPDSSLGRPEYWLYPDETHERKRDDCEGYACLTVTLCLLAGVPEWRLRVNAGWVLVGDRTGERGGHAWASYLRAPDSQWVALDGCYYSDHATPINDRTPINQRPEYYYGDEVWFAFNSRYAWGRSAREMYGRVAMRKAT